MADESYVTPTPMNPSVNVRSVTEDGVRITRVNPAADDGLPDTGEGATVFEHDPRTTEPKELGANLDSEPVEDSEEIKANKKTAAKEARDAARAAREAAKKEEEDGA